jgi:hypothetical protein
MNRELDKPDGQALALEGLGEYRLTTGETKTVAAHLHQALTIYQRLGMAPRRRARTHPAGRPDQALNPGNPVPTTHAASEVISRRAAIPGSQCTYPGNVRAACERTSRIAAARCGIR